MEKEINHPKHTTLSIKHGSVFWHFMAASGIWPLVFIDDVTADRSSRISDTYCETDWTVFIVHMNDDPKHTARVTQEFLEAKKLDILPLPSQGPNLKPTGDF